MFYVLLWTLHRKMRVSSVTDMQNLCRLATPPRGPGRRRWRPDSSIPAHDPLQHVALASYPRSGNTLLRSLLEQNVCTLTGSDMRVDSCALPLARRLRSFGLRAEGRCDASVWLIKTHFPERSGELFSPVRVFGAVVLVRNPCDAIDSLWNMRRTRSHTRSVWPLAYRYLRESFRATVRDEAASWACFHAFWLQTDAHFVRFEDLLHPVRRMATLRGIAQYLVDTQLPAHRETARILLSKLLRDEETNAGATAERLHTPPSSIGRVRLWQRGAKEGAGGVRSRQTTAVAVRSVYRPRRGTIGHSLRHYSQEDRAAVASICGEQMRRFGYCADAHSKRFSNDVAPDDPKPWRRVEEAHADDVHAHVQAEASGGPSASLSGGLWLNGDASMTRPVVSLSAAG